MRSSHAFLSIAMAVVVLLSAPAHAGRPEVPTHQSNTSSTATNDLYRPLLINTILNYYSNNGSGSYNPFSANNEGFEFPKGSRLTTILRDGLVWGVKQRDTIKVGGSVYRQGLQAGPIIVSGTSTIQPVADDPTKPVHRVYRVRRDIFPLPGVSDPQGPEAAGQRAIVENEEIPFIGTYEPATAAQLVQQYWDDWNGWPAALGAPFTDVDRNGVYDPAVDIPGPPMADQALWYVANDLSWARSVNLAGSNPIGLEMQRSVWAYRRAGALGDAIFQSSRVINKSGVPLDSVYLVQWADPDVGDAGDDFVGCDTLLDLGFAYNGNAVDMQYGSSPPAVGFLLLQGPTVPGAPTDTALYGFSRRPGARNLRMSAFNFFSSGFAEYRDPEQGLGSQGHIQWYNLMHGRTGPHGVPYLDPLTGDTALFVFAGDPVAGTGWIDGTLIGPYDRRLCIVTGPFTMAPGDTQEIAVVCYAARGADRIASVAALKRETGAVRAMYASVCAGLIAPRMTHALSRNADQAVISFRADARGAAVAGVQIQLKRYNGTVTSTIPLADDGFHGDATAGDGVFGGGVQMAPIAHGLFADAEVTYVNGDVVRWAHIADNIATADVTVSSLAVVSDHINSDGVPNPGEHVRYAVGVRNASSVTVGPLVLSASPEETGHTLQIGALGGTTTYMRPYDASDQATYLSFYVPSWTTDSVFAVALTIADASDNVWRDTLNFTVSPLRSIVYTSPVQHIAGPATGAFEISVVDTSALKDHLYIIRGVVDAKGGTTGYMVKDSTTGLVLLEDQPLPDDLGHTSPVIDGFKVLIGTIDRYPGMRSWDFPTGVRRFSPTGGCAGIGLEGFSVTFNPETYDRLRGTIGMAGNLTLDGFKTSLDVAEYHTVLLKLAAVSPFGLWDPGSAPADSNISRAYRYLASAEAAPAETSFAPWIVHTGSGYPYQGYDHSVPFSAWDMETDPPTRLAVGCLENNVTGGLVDGRYWPGTTTGNNTVAREFAFIFKSPYTATPDPALAVNMDAGASTPIMWVLTCARSGDYVWSGLDQFKINANHMPTPADLWTFNPMVVTGVRAALAPVEFALSQNYPNPFNPSTKFQYTIASRQLIDIRVYDILGRLVVTLVNEVRDPGTYSITWDARGVASGVYLCRMIAGPVALTRKMVVLR